MVGLYTPIKRPAKQLLSVITCCLKGASSRSPQIAILQVSNQVSRIPKSRNALFKFPSRISRLSLCQFVNCLELEFYPPKSSITKRKNQIAIPIVTTTIGNQIAQFILLGFSSSSFLELIPIRHRANLNQSSGYAWCYATPKGPDHPHETDETTHHN